MKKRTNKPALKQSPGQIGVAVCAFEVNASAPGEIQLTPAGLFKARDGRPEGLPGWFIDADIASGVIAFAERVSDDFVIDYDHQTLYTEKNGQPAPAAGWFRTLEWREDEGLFATGVNWTDLATARIEGKEYRYISPVIAFDKTTGNVLAILMAALTNYAAIDGMGALSDFSDLAELAAARFSFDQPNTGDNTMNDELLALLGLDANASQEDIDKATAALSVRMTSEAALRTALGIDADGDGVAAIAALKAKTTPDPKEYVPVKTMEELQTQVAALSAQINSSEVNDLVDTAMSEGKLLPAQEEWARDLGKSDTASLKAFIDKAQPVAALKGQQTQGKAPEGDDNGDTLSAADIAVCKATGVSEEDFLKTRQAKG